MKFNELKKHLTAEAPRSCYCVTGSDRYLITHAVKLLSGLAQIEELNVNRFSENAEPSEIVKACTIMPMLSKFRVVIYEGFKTLPVQIERYLAQPSADSVLVLMPSSDKVKLPNTVMAIDCNPLDRATLASFIRKHVGGNITERAAELLTDYTMGDLARITTELDKLTSYCEGRKIDIDDVDALVTRDNDYKMYQFVSEVASKRADAAYRMAAELVVELKGADALLTALYSQFRKLLFVAISRASEAEIAAAFKVKPYALKYLREQARLYSPARLKAAVDMIADYDREVKTYRVDGQTALDNVMLKIFAL